jgi:serine/threonine protein kinase
MRFEDGALICGGRYRLVQLIGAGGMAAVWRGHDRQLDRDVAIKVIADSLSGDPSYRKRFEREARLAAGVSHPNLVQIYDVGAEQERPFLIMEYIPGQTLAESLRNKPPSASVDAERLAEELLGALDQIHRLGIVHRDIKPANILLGSDGRARLTDFGIAHSSEMSSMTRTGLVVGTARYLAPEIVEQQRATPQSDLYSLGRVLLEAVAGGEVSRRLRELIDALCRLSPEERPESAEAALRILLEGPTRALPPPGTALMAPIRRRARSLGARPPIRRTALVAFKRDDGRLQVELDRSIAFGLAAIIMLALLWAIVSSASERYVQAPRLSPTSLAARPPGHRAPTTLTGRHHAARANGQV